MKSLVLKGLNSIKLIEAPVPNIQEGDLLVRMKACGICGTDIEKIRGVAATPPILGHEVSGEVVKVGRHVEEFKVGDRVFVHHHVSCGRCHYCLQGSATMCNLFTETNIEPGGFSEFFKVPKTNVARGAVLKLPQEMNFEEATFIEPLACCLRSLRKCDIKPGLSVAVIGCGPMGLLLLKCLKALGASTLMAIDLQDYRLAFAQKIGAKPVINAHKLDAAEAVKNETEGMGADLVIVATCSEEAFRQGFSLVRRGGLVSVFGAPAKDAETPLGLGKLFYDEVTILPSYSTTEVETETALTLIKHKRVEVLDLVTHRYHLDEVAGAFEIAMSGTLALKVLVTSS